MRFVKFNTPGSVIGKLDRLDTGVGYDGTAVDQLIVSLSQPYGGYQPGDQVLISLSQVVLRKKVAEKAPRPGDWIRIDYLGRVESERTGRTYMDFAVDVA